MYSGAFAQFLTVEILGKALGFDVFRGVGLALVFRAAFGADPDGPPVQAAAPQLYEIIFDQVSEKYGIISHIGDPKIWAAFPAITADRVLVEQIVAFLCDKEVPPEIFKNLYLSGGLLCGLE